MPHKVWDGHPETASACSGSPPLILPYFLTFPLKDLSLSPWWLDSSPLELVSPKTNFVHPTSLLFQVFFHRIIILRNTLLIWATSDFMDSSPV